VDAPMQYLACIAHLISPLTRQHSNTACLQAPKRLLHPRLRTAPAARPHNNPVVCLRLRAHASTQLCPARAASKRIAVLGLGLPSPLFLNPGLEIIGDYWRSFDDGSTHRLLSPDLLSLKTDRNSNLDVFG
jgi:hypothetical protein